MLGSLVSLGSDRGNCPNEENNMQMQFLCGFESAEMRSKKCRNHYDTHANADDTLPFDLHYKPQMFCMTSSIPPWHSPNAEGAPTKTVSHNAQLAGALAAGTSGWPLLIVFCAHPEYKIAKPYLCKSEETFQYRTGIGAEYPHASGCPPWFVFCGSGKQRQVL